MNNSDYLHNALRTEKLPEMDSAMTCLAIRPQLYRLLHAGMGLTTESGEFMDQLKRTLIYGKDPDFANLFEEIGDVLWYCAIALDALRSDFPSAMQTNIDKLKKRFPEKFEKMQALVRDLDSERKTLEQGYSRPEYRVFSHVLFEEAGQWVPLNEYEHVHITRGWEPERDHNHPRKFYIGHLVVHAAKTTTGHVYDAVNGWRS